MAEAGQEAQAVPRAGLKTLRTAAAEVEVARAEQVVLPGALLMLRVRVPAAPRMPLRRS